MPMDDLKNRLIEIIRERSFQYSNEAKFKLSSGASSHFYFNMKKTTHSPEGMHLVGELVFNKIKKLGLRTKAIGGLTMGADPIAVATAMHSYTVKEPISSFVVRKERKAHGLGLQIEGDIKKGDHVIIVDDVVTTGASTIKAIEAAKEYGLIIDAVIILVDRCEQNGRESIEALGYPVYNILTIRDFMPAHN